MATLRDAEALVGLPYMAGRFDCMHLTVMAQHRLWGRTVRWRNRRHPASPGAQRALVQASLPSVARPLADGEAPADGDAVLWLALDAEGDHFHIGTLLLHAGERWVLHTSEALGASVLQRLAECPMTGLRLEGLYRWL